MASLNKVYLIGNLTRDPDLRYTNSGAGVCNMGMATSRKYTTASGEQREDTCFVDVDVWGKQAEACRNYLHRGSPVFVEGRLRLDQWDDSQSGRKMSRLKVTAERVQFISNRPQGAPPQTQGFQAPGPQAPAPQPVAPQPTYAPPVAAAPPFPVDTAPAPAVAPPSGPPPSTPASGTIDDIPF